MSLTLARFTLAVLLATSMATAAATDARSWVRVHGAADQLDARLHSGNVIDYGAFRWLPMASADIDALRAEGLEIHVVERPFELDLGGQRFDPLNLTAQLSAAPFAGWQATPEPDWRLVQFQGPVKQQWLDELAAAGIEPVQYIHPHTYVVWADATAQARAGQLPGVRWQGEFLPDYRLPPVMRRDGEGLIAVSLLARPGLADLDQRLAALAVTVQDRGRLDRHLDMLTVQVAASRLPQLASLPGIYAVQPVIEPFNRSETSVQINFGNVDAGGLAYPGYLAFLENLELDGSGVIMACVDSGTQANHPDLINRMLPCTGPTCGNGTQGGDHGTHVAGIMAADGSSGLTNSHGLLRGLGMAPGAQLIEQRYTFAAGTPAYLNRMRDSVRNGAVLSNNSWGGSGPAGYESTARQVDIGSRDADTDATGDQPLLYVLAIDNGGGGTSSQGIPDEAKNIFTIGSAWAQVDANTQDLRNEHISANSGHGPALDGRFIPHMIANSRFTDSTAGSSGYVMQGGTSQAAPHVAGAAGLFFQYYRELAGADPSPALVKAAFLPVSQDLVGNNDANNNPIGARPDRKQGWGRMRPAAVLAPELPVVYVDQEHVFDATGQSWQQTWEAGDPDQPMRLMLVWTDAPGHGLGSSTPAWNNDLDLRVQADDQLYLGNVFTDGWSATGGSAEHRNNTEGVFLRPDQHGGVIAVEVLAADINSNALPNAGASNAQDFALVCYNCQPAGSAPGADLALSLADVPDPVIAGNPLTWVVNVVNFGPDDSGEITVVLELPDGTDYGQARTVDGGSGRDWTCLPDAGQVTCTLATGTPAASLAPVLEIDALVDVRTPAGLITTIAQVSAIAADPDTGNNHASETTQVLASPEILLRDGFECGPERPGC
ncbi:MAG: S8 family serine peptidase [Xanthomonadales bacterium]|nr:S8 family serine peptidase [Xanthomonadales bacterium]